MRARPTLTATRDPRTPHVLIQDRNRPGIPFATRQVEPPHGGTGDDAAGPFGETWGNKRLREKVLRTRFLRGTISPDFLS